MVDQRASAVRVAAFRSSALSLENSFSIGFKSGEYGGRYSSVAPAEVIASWTPLTLWLLRLSRMTTSPVFSAGARNWRA